MVHEFGCEFGVKRREFTAMYYKKKKSNATEITEKKGVGGITH